MGVRRVLVPGVDRAQWVRALELDGGPLALRFAVGVHPRFSGSIADVQSFAEELDAAAIGEFGWDRSVPADDALADAHLELAKSLALPVVLHVVGMHGHAIERLRRHDDLCGVVHAYSGSAELVQAYVALGLHVSIGPSVLEPDARKVHAAALAIPSERLLIETDAPDQISEPAGLVRVAEALARIRGGSLSELAEVTFANAEELFA